MLEETGGSVASGYGPVCVGIVGSSIGIKFGGGVGLVVG